MLHGEHVVLFDLVTEDHQKQRFDAMTEFIEWATAEWGIPTEAEMARAEEIWSNR